MKETESDMKKQGDSREYLANERTFMAWIRTAIAIMAFGFVAVKFSIFLRQFSLLAEKTNQLPNKGYSSIVGLVILTIGALIIPFAFLRYRQVNNQLDRGQFTNSQTLPILLTLLLVLISIILISYLISSIT